MRVVPPMLCAVLVVAGCATPAPPPRPAVVPPTAAAPPGPVSPPPKPAWTARKVLANAIAVRAGSTTVRAGEGLGQVAARTGVPAGAIAAANALSATATLRAGQPLKLPGGRVHTVHAGETGISIARAYGVDWNRVVTANRLSAPFRIEIGDRLLLPSPRQVAAMSIEERAAAFRIDIDDLITGAEPAAAPERPARQAPAKPAASARPPALATPRFAWPVDGRILSTFGAKPGGRFNDGINVATAAGTAVRATADGVVAYAGDAVAGFGNLVLIKHADGWVSAYGHNQSLAVARGDHVRQGDVIATAGTTGAVDEPQLHFELRHGRAAVDPQRILPPARQAGA